MTLDERKVIEQAIGHLSVDVVMFSDIETVRHLLRTLLKQEIVAPVAWMVTSERIDGTQHTYPLSGRYKDVLDMCDFGDPIPLYTAPPTTQCPVPIEEVKEMVDRLRVAARWGTMTSEFNPEDRIEYMAANLIERLAGIKES